MFNKRPSRFEDLSNELWLEIFEYFDWISLFTAFYGLNRRIDQLIHSIKVLSLYSSYLLKQCDSLDIPFQEFPIEKITEIRHFRLTYDDTYGESFNIVKQLSFFSTLISLTINGHFDHREGIDYQSLDLFGQNCPSLRRWCLQGTLFNQKFPLEHIPYTFYFPSLRYISVDMLHYMLALRILEQCPQLRSFSAKLYIYPLDNIATVSSALSSTRIGMGLPNIKTLKLGGDQDYSGPFVTKFLERLLPCCPNLQTFFFDYLWYQGDRNPLNPPWWATVLGSHIRLKHLSLRLDIHGTLKALSNDIVHQFEFLPFFAQLKVNVAYTINRMEFPHMSHIYCIKN